MLSAYSDVIRFTAPTDNTIPGTITQLELFASFQNVLFVFTNVTDTDINTYEYQLYADTAITNPNAGPYTLVSGATPVSSGTGTSSVFSVPLVSPIISSYVDGAGVTQQKSFFGRVRAIDTSGNIGNWSSIVKTSTSTPLIDEQYIVSLTASRITAGKIGAHEIILTQPGAQTSYTAPSGVAVLRSSDYSQGSAGWLIRGDGLAEFNNLTVRTQLDIGGNDSTSFHVDVNGNMWSGAGIGNFSTAPFRVTNAGVLTATNANITGAITATSGTFTGTISGSTITGSTITGNNISTGDIYIREPVSGRYYLTYLLGDYMQVKRTQSDYSTITGSGAFLGYFNASAVADDAAMIVNSTTPYTSGTYVSAQSNGNIVSTGTIYSGNLNISSGSASFGSSVRQMINLWSTSYGIGVQSSTQYFRSGQNFAWYTGGSHADGALDAGGGTRRMYLSNGDLVVGSSITLGSHTMTSDTWRFIINPNNYSNLQIGIGEYYAGAGVYASGSDLSLIGSGAVRFKTGGSNSQWGVISPSGFDIWSGIIVASTNFDGTWRNENNGYYKLAQNPWSTRRVKVDIKEVGEQLNPNKLLDIPIVQFKYMEGYLAEGDPIYNTDICGLLAEEVFEHYPTVVRLDSETWEPQSINYQLMIPPLLGLVQKLEKRISELESKI